MIGGAYFGSPIGGGLLGEQAVTPLGLHPWPDMMTTLTPALHTTLLTLSARSSSLTEFDRSTTATLDE